MSRKIRFLMIANTLSQVEAKAATLFGVNKLLFQPALAAEIIGIGLSAASGQAEEGFPDCR